MDIQAVTVVAKKPGYTLSSSTPIIILIETLVHPFLAQAQDTTDGYYLPEQRLPCRHLPILLVAFPLPD